ncbi:MAG: hypothetical protein GX073_07875 [Firmicutes bacterium]|nr:hypothetical protein [Bacillota bacterium]
MKFNFKFERDGNYYFGLGLLVLASASIVWAFFFDGFEPKDFLVYFLVYAWGYTLLLKSDCEYRFKRLEETVTVLQNRLDKLEAGFSQEIEVRDGEGTEEDVTAGESEAESAITTEHDTPEQPADQDEKE